LAAGNYTFAFATGTLKVTPATSKIVVVPSVAVPVAFQPVTYTATVSPVAPATLVPTGNVVVNLSSGFPNSPPSTVTQTAVVNAGGQMTATGGQLPAGVQISVAATFQGDGNFLGSTAPKVSQSVQQVAVQPDPQAANKTALAVGGTVGNDTITFQPAGAGGVTVSVNGVNQGTFQPNAHLLAYGGPGNDTIALAATSVPVSTPAVLDGGDGNDVLDAQGSTATNVLLGSAGNDDLRAGSGATLLIGGLGADRLEAASGNAILIGGSTTYDPKLADLLAIVAEWARTDVTYDTRVAHLTGTAGGINASDIFTKTTVLNDGTADDLIGSKGNGSPLNWYWTATNDGLRKRNSGEVVSSY
jgi:Bacterial Ig-like domain (group 3)